MTFRQRVLDAINHREPDHVPLDIGGTDVTGLHIDCAQQLLPRLGVSVSSPIPVADTVQQLAELPEEALIRLNAHCRGFFPKPPSTWKMELHRDSVSHWFNDEWGVEWRKNHEYALYYDISSHPLAGKNRADIERYPWPDPFDADRLKGLAKTIDTCYQSGEYAIILSGITGGGALEMASWMAGFENIFVMMMSEPDTACALLDHILEVKINFWRAVLPVVGSRVDIISESEDLGYQDRLMMAPGTFRKIIKPRLTRLFSEIKALAPHVKIFLHSDGAIASIIPDLIEAGVDILNPVQVSAMGMNETAALKLAFGKDLVFWGAIDTQYVLPFGTQQSVRDEVRRRIDDLAPGGGYVMASVHNLQSGVPASNIQAMLEAWAEYGKS